MPLSCCFGHEDTQKMGADGFLSIKNVDFEDKIIVVMVFLAIFAPKRKVNTTWENYM